MSKRENSGFRAVVIGASSGGFTAITTILVGLPESFSFSILVVLHRGRETGNYLEQSLNEKCMFPVKQAEDKEKIETGTVYFAPPDYHLLVEDDRTLSLSSDPPVNYSRPSVDVLFESAAEVFGPELVGIVLTGANQDGSRGLARIRALGGVGAVQDPVSAEFSTMPRSALEAASPEYVMPAEEMSRFLSGLGRKSKRGKNGTKGNRKYPDCG